MLRWIRIPLGLVLILSVSGGTARAQYGWGWGGWGGWGETPQGSIARGLGALYAGAGYGAEMTAVANSINYDTWQRWNQYLYESNREATRLYLAKKNFDIQNNKNSYNQIIKRLQDNPTSRDVYDGDALNAALDQLSDPRLHSSTLRQASKPVPREVVANIPFRYASEAVTIILSNLKGANEWPPALNITRFAEDKKEFDAISEQARKEDEDGEISPDTISRAKALIARMRAKLAQEPLAVPKDNLAAERFLKTAAGLVKLLEKPDTKAVLDQLNKVPNTTVGSLIGFMHLYNLRFGAATTPQQREIYEKLYSMLDEARDLSQKALEGSNTVAAGPAEPKAAVDLFSNMNLDDLAGKPKKKAAPQPPQPQE